MSAGAFSSQDPKVVSVFEIVGSYFVDTVFNHVYHSSNSSVTGATSLTDEYVRQVQAYCIGVKTDSRCYSDVVQGVHTYFVNSTRFTTMSFAEFVDRIVGVCIPEMYFRQFSPQDKDEMLSSIMCDLISNLAAFATRPEMLRRIIDGHAVAPEVTVRMLQDAAVKSLLTKRSELHNKFLMKVSQARDYVSMDTVEEMKRALRRLVKEKADASARAAAAEAAAAAAQEKIRAFKEREGKLLRVVDMLRRAKAEGAAVVGAGLRLPRQETLAETKSRMDAPEPARVPHQERIAERARSESDDGSSESSGRRRPGAARRPVSARGTPLSASFFKTAVIPVAAPAAAPEPQKEPDDSHEPERPAGRTFKDMIEGDEDYDYE